MTKLSALSSVLLTLCLAACRVETVSNDDDDNDSDNGAAGSAQAGAGGATSDTGGKAGSGGEPAHAGGGESQAGAAGRSTEADGGQGGAVQAVGGAAGTAGATAGEGGEPNAVAGAGGVSGSAGAAGSATAQGGAAGSGTTTLEDPAPFATEPGETSECEDAPDTDLTVFEYTDVDASTMTFEGTVEGASGPGVYYVSGGAQVISGTVPTDSSTGKFEVELPLFCGEQTVKLVWTNAECQVAAVSRVVRIDCSTDDIRLTLSWDDLGDDFELHLIKPGGRINDNATDCTWTSCISASPDWGVEGDTTDNPRKDVDNTGAYGPENIYYSKPEDGTYTVMVEHWGSGSPEADGKVIFNVAAHTYEATIENLAPGFVWTAGTIEWPSGEVTTSQAVYDCTATWNSGCKAEIP